MGHVYIASAVRTPIGKFGGALMEMSAADMGVAAVHEALVRAGIEPANVEEVIAGHARQAGNGPNLARQIAIRSSIPATTPAFTVNKACGSGLKAIMLGSNEIRLDNAGVVVAAGSESMSRVPYLVQNARWGLRLGDQKFIDGMYQDGFFCPLAGMVMGETAEILASQYKISRREQDEYAVESQQRAGAALKSGRFHDELVALDIPGKKGEVHRFDTDEHVRPNVSLSDMEKLPPVFSKDGTITAGNSSGITDGAAAIVLVSEKEVQRRGLKPMARILDYASGGVEPRVMGLGPVPAVQKLLTKTAMKLSDFGLIELNEAFAAQVLACTKELPIEREKLNVNGGAIALGHPIGCTGVRIVATLVHEMRRRSVRFGLATLCISGGMGLALALENTDVHS